MTKKKELNEELVENVSGGNGGRGAMRVLCACGCGKAYYENAFSWPKNGSVLGTCSKGWKASIHNGITAKFYNETLNQTKYADFTSNY